MPPHDDVYFIDADVAASRKAGSVPERADKERPARRRFFGRSAPASDTTVGRAAGRRPLAAASLSLLLCGAGQLYNGRRDAAVLYFVIEALTAAVDWCLWKMWDPLLRLLHVFFIEPTDVMVVVAAWNLALALFVVGAALQAYGEASASEAAEPLQRPAVSALASLVLPGWGQYLNAQPHKAALLMGLYLTAAYAFVVSRVWPGLWRLWDTSQQMIFGFDLTLGGIAALAIGVVVYLSAFYDALLVARRQRSGVS